MPTMVVINGATELKMDVIPLSSCVCANANKNGGKNELPKPAKIIHFQSIQLSLLRLRKPKTKRVNEANTIRKLPSCKAE